MSDIDKPLPGTFWGPIEGAPVHIPQQPQEPTLEEAWGPTFAEFGMTATQAMQKYYGSTSVLLGGLVSLNTPEIVYRHMKAEQAVKEQPIKKLDERERDASGRFLTPELKAQREARKERAELVNKKNEEWRKAVADRRESVRQWDIYVAAKKLEYQKARDSL